MIEILFFPVIIFSIFLSIVIIGFLIKSNRENQSETTKNITQNILISSTVNKELGQKLDEIYIKVNDIRRLFIKLNRLTDEQIVELKNVSTSFNELIIKNYPHLNTTIDNNYAPDILNRELQRFAESEFDSLLFTYYADVLRFITSMISYSKHATKESKKLDTLQSYGSTTINEKELRKYSKANFQSADKIMNLSFQLLKKNMQYRVK